MKITRSHYHRQSLKNRFHTHVYSEKKYDCLLKINENYYKSVFEGIHLSYSNSNIIWDF